MTTKTKNGTPLGYLDTEDDSHAGVDTIARLAMEASSAQELEPGKLYLKTKDDGSHQLVDTLHHMLERDRHLEPRPRRKTGSVTLADADSLVRYVNRHKTDDTVLYADVIRGTILAVLNDHGAAQGPDEAAGYGDFRAYLALASTKEWRHWTLLDGKLAEQQRFAEHIEQGLLEIQHPPAAEMLDLAQHMEGHKSVAYKFGKVLSDGSRQFRYEETVDTKAGQSGQVVIPKEFLLGIVPWEGCDRYEVTALLRYRISTEGQLQIGYVLVRPEDVLRTAFEDVLATVAQQTAVPVLKGTYGTVAGT